jgi:hypothetical protein
MESAFYGYYYATTDCISNAWDTMEIEAFLLSKDCFVIDGMGSFKHDSTFLSLQLMLVKDYNSWSSNDYSKDKTNYIAITTAKEIDPDAKQFFRDFEKFLGCCITEETDSD